VLALIYLQAWSMLLCTHIYIIDAVGLHTAYGVKCCVSNTVCVIIVAHLVTWFYANTVEARAQQGIGIGEEPDVYTRKLGISLM